MDRSRPALKPLRNIHGLYFWILPLLFLGLFLFYPLYSILQFSFLRPETQGTLPLWQVLKSSTTVKVLWFTFYQALFSTVLTLLLGLPGAFLFARYKFKGKTLLQALTVIPFILPTLVVAAAFNALLGPRGWLNWMLMESFHLSRPPIQFMYTFTAILTAHVFYNTTIVLRTVGDFWAKLDPHIDQAAQVLGANRFQRFFAITLPLLAPSILAASLLVFLFDFTSFGVVLILGGPQFSTLEVEIYTQAVGMFDLPTAASLSLIQLVFTLGITILYSRLAERASRPLVLKPTQITQNPLNDWRRRLLALGIGGLLLIFLASPIFALGLRSFFAIQPATSTSNAITKGFTLSYYQELSVNRRNAAFYVPPSTAIGISLTYAGVTVILALCLGFPAAWALSRGPSLQVNRWFDPILMLPLGTSAVTLGLGFILALGREPLNLRASPVLVPIAHTLVALPFVVRSLTPVLQSIRPQLRQAAQVLGASPFRVFSHVELPIISRAVLSAATFAFTISLGEFGATSLISRPEYPTIPMMIYRLLSQPGSLNYGQAMALSTILMLVCAAGMFFIERLRFTGEGGF
jgi:thiamine transport system permease protein